MSKEGRIQEIAQLLHDTDDETFLNRIYISVILHESKTVNE